jgi:hypothetical protein
MLIAPMAAKADLLDLRRRKCVQKLTFDLAHLAIVLDRLDWRRRLAQFTISLRNPDVPQEGEDGLHVRGLSAVHDKRLAPPLDRSGHLRRGAAH